MRTFIGGVGSRDSAERSIGRLVSQRLAGDAPINAARVVVSDLSADPTEVAERLNSEWPKFERVILVGAVARARPAGTVTAYRWDGDAPNEDAALDGDDQSDDDGGAFDRTLRALRELIDLPEEIIVVEVEPEVAQRRDGSAAVERARTLVRRLATSSRAATDLPSYSLGGAPPRRHPLAD